MGIWDWLTGNTTSTQDQNISTTANEDVTKSSLDTSTQVSTQETGTTSASQQETNQLTSVTSLDEETQNLIRSFLGTLTANPAVSDSSNTLAALASSLGGKAMTNGGDIQTAIQGILGAQKASGLKAIDTNTTKAATQAGSSLNSVVQQMKNDSLVDLTTQLAGTEGQLTLAGRELANTEAGTAIAALDKAIATPTDAANSQAKAIAYLGDILKGSTTTAEVSGITSASGEEQSTTNSQQMLIKALQELASGKTISSSSGTTEQTQGSTLLDWLKLFT